MKLSISNFRRKRSMLTIFNTTEESTWTVAMCFNNVQDKVLNFKLVS